MNPPKCKLCGETHWGSVCPKFRKAKPDIKAIETKAKTAGTPKKKRK